MYVYPFQSRSQQKLLLFQIPRQKKITKIFKKTKWRDALLYFGGNYYTPLQLSDTYHDDAPPPLPLPLCSLDVGLANESFI
jgi:hypothetical protein